MTLQKDAAVGAGRMLGGLTPAVDSGKSGSHTHASLSVRKDADNAVLSHCTPGAGALQQPGAAAWKALLARAERLMAADEARYGLHWLVWLSCTYARNGWRWEAEVLRG